MNLKRNLMPLDVRSLLALFCSILLVPGNLMAYIPSAQAAPASDGQAAAIPSEQLDSLVAPIALYPDSLLAQVLAASTYPLEIIQLQQWLGRNSGLKDQALADAVKKQPWDPSVQSLAGLPDVVKRLADDIQWTTDLGNAFLAQEGGVMNAVQRMRKSAQDGGKLKTTEQQVVETRVVESKQVIVIEQANPDVVYAPSYNPTVVWGAPYYPYPPIYYPPPGYYAAGMAISFGVGMAMGALWSGGWGCGWGSNNININNNNNFIRNSNVNRGNIGSGSGNNRWQHNPSHRGGAPYRDRSTADRFGGTARGDSLANRQATARQQVGRQGGQFASNRAGAGAGVSNRAGAGGGDRIGSRDVSGRSGGRSNSAFSGRSQGFSGSSARASSMRGSASMRSRGGGRRR